MPVNNSIDKPTVVYGDFDPASKDIVVGIKDKALARAVASIHSDEQCRIAIFSGTSKLDALNLELYWFLDKSPDIEFEHAVVTNSVDDDTRYHSYFNGKIYPAKFADTVEEASATNAFVARVVVKEITLRLYSFKTKSKVEAILDMEIICAIEMNKSDKIILKPIKCVIDKSTLTELIQDLTDEATANNSVLKTEDFFTFMCNRMLFPLVCDFIGKMEICNVKEILDKIKTITNSKIELKWIYFMVKEHQLFIGADFLNIQMEGDNERTQINLTPSTFDNNDNDFFLSMRVSTLSYLLSRNIPKKIAMNSTLFFYNGYYWPTGEIGDLDITAMEYKGDEEYVIKLAKIYSCLKHVGVFFLPPVPFGGLTHVWIEPMEFIVKCTIESNKLKVSIVNIKSLHAKFVLWDLNPISDILNILIAFLNDTISSKICDSLLKLAFEMDISHLDVFDFSSLTKPLNKKLVCHLPNATLKNSYHDIHISTDTRFIVETKKELELTEV